MSLNVVLNNNVTPEGLLMQKCDGVFFDKHPSSLTECALRSRKQFVSEGNPSVEAEAVMVHPTVCREHIQQQNDLATVKACCS